MPSIRRTAATATLALAFTSTVVAAQPGAGLDRPDFSPMVRAVGGFVFTLLVGGVTLVVAPRYVDRVVEQVREDALASFLWGVGVLALVIGLAVLLAITVVGLVVALPLLFAFFVLGVVGNALGYLALLDGAVDGRGVALLVGAAFAGAMAAIPLLGDLVGFVVGSVGVGAMIRVWRS